MGELIVNADDAGIDVQRDAGLLLAVLVGVVSWLSVMVTRSSPLTAVLVAAARCRPRMGIGLHVDLTDGPYLSRCFADQFYAPPRQYLDKREFWSRAIQPRTALDAVQVEVGAQIAAFRKSFGFMPHHLDSHNHAHIADPRVFAIFQALQREHRIGYLRLPNELLKPGTLRALARLDLERGEDSAALVEDFLRRDKLPRRVELVERMRRSAVCDALLYEKACRLLPVGDGYNYRGTTYGWMPSRCMLAQIRREARALDHPTLLTVHPGLNMLRSRSCTFSSPGRISELCMLITSSAEERMRGASRSWARGGRGATSKRAQEDPWIV
jgi:predicted glycoside hydrolase/deacetylase ChbG (UPF0249 family)